MAASTKKVRDKKSCEQDGYIQCEYGRLYDSDTLFMRNYVGEATSKDGREYEISTNFGSGQPIIHLKAHDGKWWTIGWSKLIELAISEGLNT